MNRRPWLCRTAGLAVSLFWAPFALADVPPAMDRVPAEAPVVFAMKNMGGFYQNVNALAKSIGLPPQAMGGLARGAELLKTAGLNADGSAAVALLSVDGNDDDGEPMVMVLPVKDYAAFAKALGGDGEGLDEVTINDKPGFLKNLGGGFAALGPTRAFVEKFTGAAGSGKTFESLMGANGRAVSEYSDAFVVANIEKVRPVLEERVEEMREQMAMMAAMGGGNEAQADMFKSAADAFLRDAAAGVAGLKAAESGLGLEFAAQFKEGSELAKYFDAKGNASRLIGSLPNLDQGFLFAGAVDLSSSALKNAFKKMLEFQQAQNPEAAKLFSGLNPMDQMEKTDGMAFVMGQPPALMGGLFLNTALYVKTSDPQGYVKTMREAMGKLNGQAVEGITYQTVYQSGSAKVGEQSVDVWTMRMQADPENPMAQQIQQMQAMIFGPMGLSGYVAPAEGGVVLTYSKNSDLMSKTFEAAKGGTGLSQDAGVKSVAANLPANRTGEVYIGVRNILDTALGFAAMMGGPGPQVNIPEDLPPVGLGSTSDSGGLRLRVYVPTKVMTTVKGVMESMNGGGMDDMDDDEEMDPSER